MKYLSNPFSLYQDQIKQLYYIYSKNIIPNSIIFSSKESEITKNIMTSFAILLTEEKSIHTLEEFCNEIFKKEIVQSPYIYFVERVYLDDKKRLKEKIYRADINFIHDFFSVKDDLGQKRICVVDSIDDLSEDASNSLLKIIEEPTKNSHFLFLNKSKSKLLDTISSRSRILNFGKIHKDTFLRTFENDSISNDFLHNLTHGSIQLAQSFNDYNFESRNYLDLEGLVSGASQEEWVIKFLDNITSVAENILPGQKVDCVVYGCTSGTIISGYDNIKKKINMAKPDALVTAPSTAALNALKKKNINKISIVTPYIKSVNNDVVKFFKNNNFDVTSNTYFDIKSDVDIGRVDQNQLFEILSNIDHKNAEALFVSCTSLPVLDIIEKLEKKLNMTVLSSNQALIWETLESINKNNSIKGYGSLFS